MDYEEATAKGKMLAGTLIVSLSVVGILSILYATGRAICGC